MRRTELCRPGQAEQHSACAAYSSLDEKLAVGGMGSNHRLVLFTHALCRLSYPTAKIRREHDPLSVTDAWAWDRCR
jgi:hypothetical protein